MDNFSENYSANIWYSLIHSQYSLRARMYLLHSPHHYRVCRRNRTKHIVVIYVLCTLYCTGYMLEWTTHKSISWYLYSVNLSPPPSTWTPTTLIITFSPTCSPFYYFSPPAWLQIFQPTFSEADIIDIYINMAGLDKVDLHGVNAIVCLL